MRGTRTSAALLTLALALTGCGASAGGGERSQGDTKAAAPAEPGADGYGGSAADAAKEADTKAPEAGKRAPVPSPQHVIRTASLSVEVRDAARALATARRVAAAAGGHVSNETTERVDDSHVTSHVVLRVPQERYESVLAELAGTGRLLSRTADAKDVTEQVVDVESRIDTQRASVQRVRALMEKATKLSDVVTLEGELSRRQADLESLLAQQASLRDRTTLATITLDLVEPENAQASRDEGRPGFLDALGGGWNALVTALAWAGIVLAAVAPWLAAAAALYAVWRLLLRPRLSRRTRTAASAPPAGGAAGAPLPVQARNAAGAPLRTADPEAPAAPRED
ncbi:DUF4349 domain-containing protein [Streptomyces sp. NPDC006464]|uniref:DUF4349 domain-containing protein n=1 Tax=Streptomyces sp. NPDC006464 TaxID=3154305 RepID=UPI0033B25BD5